MCSWRGDNVITTSLVSHIRQRGLNPWLHHSLAWATTQSVNSQIPHPPSDEDINWLICSGAFHAAVVVKNLPAYANAGDVRHIGSIPGLGRSPGEGNGNSFQYSCLQNPMDREAWWATVCRVTKCQTWLKQLSTHMTLGPNFVSQ